MQKLRQILNIILTWCAIAPCVSSCISDDITSDPSVQPIFSVDSLKMGELFTDEMSPTFRFTVHNRSPKGIIVSRIYLSEVEGAEFYVNVDGFSGNEFNDIEIRGKDSIYVLVKGKLSANGKLGPVETGGWLNFETNGQQKRLRLQAFGTDAERLTDFTLTSDMVLTSAKPYRVFGTLTVPEGMTLKMDKGARIHFHDKAELNVEGSLVADGDAGEPVIMTGDRTGNVVADISFDLMSKQWGGVKFVPGSKNNLLRHTVIKNTDSGIKMEGEEEGNAPEIEMINCVLRNSASTVLSAVQSKIRAVGCEFAEGGEGLVSVTGGPGAEFVNCTFANNYLFSAISGPALGIYAKEEKGKLPKTKAVNCIFYGLGSELSAKDYKNEDVMFDYCLFKSAGSDDNNFKNCIWDSDPLYFTVRNEYIFDYRLKKESPAIGSGKNVDWTEWSGAEKDFFGKIRGAKPDIGAYVHDPSLDKEE